MSFRGCIVSCLVDVHLSSSPSGAGAHLYADSPGQPLQRCECQGGRVNDPQWNGDETL